MSGEKKESVFDKWKRRDSEQSNALPDIARLSLTSPKETPKVSGVKLKKKVAIRMITSVDCGLHMMKMAKSKRKKAII